MFDEKTIQNLRNVYNKEHPNESPISSKDAWNQLKARFHKKCKQGKSECIIANMLSKPKAPDSWMSSPTEWLSSKDIENVEKEFMKLIPTYKFLGCIPIDFDLKSESGKCLVDTLCSLKIKDLYAEGFTRFGIVFNTDVHDGPGQHWFALYCDIRPELEYARITYFDSYASKPEPEIKVLMKRWKEEWGQKMNTTYNTTRHQYKDSECGMYCLYFHYCCLNEISMNEKIPDDVINEFRKLLFKR
jgi:hypothetical protein